MVADAGLLDLLEKIEKHGWAVQYVLGGEDPEEPPFGYTVGLTVLGHPEVVLQGLPPRSAMAYLNLVGEFVRDGGRIVPGTITYLPLPDGRRSRCAYIEATDTSELIAVEQIYDDVRAVQYIWSDSADHLPWEPGWRNDPDAQPLLGPVPASWHTDRPGPIDGEERLST